MAKTVKSSRSSLFLPILLVVTGGAVIILNLTGKIKNEVKAPVKNQMEAPAETKPEVEQTVTKTKDGVRVDNIVKTSPATDKPTFPGPTENESALALTKFWITAKINFPVPKALRYEKVELDAENVIALHGFNPADGTDLLIIARSAITHPGEIAPFLHEANLGKTPDKEIWPKELPEPEKSVSLPAVTKLLPAKIWRFRGKGQDRIYALSNRTDKLGSYVIVYSVPKGNLNRSEEFLIALMKEAIAQ